MCVFQDFIERKNKINKIFKIRKIKMFLQVTLAFSMNEIFLESGLFGKLRKIVNVLEKRLVIRNTFVLKVYIVEIPFSTSRVE